MKFVLQNKHEGKTRQTKRAVDHFKRCPLCGDANLIPVRPEVLCSKCDWNSASWSVSRGSMDNIFGAAMEDAAEARRDHSNRDFELDDPIGFERKSKKANG